MQISNDAYLAVECLVQLRSCTRQRPGKTLWLSRAINRSVSYTEAIMSRLRRAEFVEAKKGSGGGYYLSRPAELITIDQVFQAFDQPTTPERLAAGTRRNGHSNGNGNGNGHGSGHAPATASGLSAGAADHGGNGAHGGNGTNGSHGAQLAHGANGGNGSHHGNGTNGANGGNGAYGGNGTLGVGHKLSNGSPAIVTGSNQLWEDLRQYVLMVLSGITIADVGESGLSARSMLSGVPRAQSHDGDSRAPCHPCAPHPCSPCQPCRPA